MSSYGTHSGDLRVGLQRMQADSIQRQAQAQATTRTQQTQQQSGSRAGASSSSSSSALLLARLPPAFRSLSIRGQPVPAWAVLSGGVILGAAAAAAFMIALRRLWRRRRQQKSAPTPFASQTATPASATPASAAAAATATDGSLASTSGESGTDTGGEDGVEDDGSSSLLLGEMLEEPTLSEAENAFRRLCARVLTRIGGQSDEYDFEDDPDSMPPLEGSDEYLVRFDPEAAVRARMDEALAHYNAASRALAAHLLLAVNAFHLTQARSELEFYQLMAKQRVDMEVAWSLLNLPLENSYETRQLDVLRIQVAQCLRDGKRMLTLLQRMSATPQQGWNVEESMLLYTAAPLLGRWDECVRFGDHLRARFPEAEVLHSSSMDYNELWRMAHEQRHEGNAPLEQLLWKDFRVVSQRIRLVKALCENKQILAELEGQFSSTNGSLGPDGLPEKPWQALEVGQGSELVRCGALAQCKSFSPAGIPLVGPADDKNIWVRGSFLMGDKRSTQQETWRLKRVARSDMQGEPPLSPEQQQQLQQQQDADGEEAEQYWKGTYVMLQEQKEDSPPSLAASSASSSSSSPDSGLASLCCTFELELILQPRPSHAVLAANAEAQEAALVAAATAEVEGRARAPADGE